MPDIKGLVEHNLSDHEHRNILPCCQAKINVMPNILHKRSEQITTMLLTDHVVTQEQLLLIQDRWYSWRVTNIPLSLSNFNNTAIKNNLQILYIIFVSTGYTAKNLVLFSANIFNELWMLFQCTLQVQFVKNKYRIIWTSILRFMCFPSKTCPNVVGPFIPDSVRMSTQLPMMYSPIAFKKAKTMCSIPGMET